VAGGKSFKRAGTGSLPEDSDGKGKGKGGKDKKSGPPISPPVAIAAVLCLGAAGYLGYQMMAPAPPPPEAELPRAVATVIDGPARATGDVFASDATESPGLPPGMVATDNPYVAGATYSYETLSTEETPAATGGAAP
jgi:hypothetical protein